MKNTLQQKSKSFSINWTDLSEEGLKNLTIAIVEYWIKYSFPKKRQIIAI